MSTSTALTTVKEQSSLTLGDPAGMTNSQLAVIVIEGVQKFRTYLPYIIALKNRFDAGDRDSTNRLRKPIKDCYSWKEFCETHLDRTDRAVRKALASPNPKKPAQASDADFANYEREHPTIRQSAANMLGQGMTPTDVVDALNQNMDVPAELAAAAVRFVTSQQQSKYDPADAVRAITAFMDKLVRQMSPQETMKVYQQIAEELKTRISVESIG